jgi:hypothetical protein
MFNGIAVICSESIECVIIIIIIIISIINWFQWQAVWIYPGQSWMMNSAVSLSVFQPVRAVC